MFLHEKLNWIEKKKQDSSLKIVGTKFITEHLDQNSEEPGVTKHYIKHTKIQVRAPRTITWHQACGTQIAVSSFNHARAGLGTRVQRWLVHKQLWIRTDDVVKEMWLAIS